MQATSTPFVSFNIEFLFYLLYLLLTGQLFQAGGEGGPNVVGPPEWLVFAQLWWERISIVSLVITGILLVVLVHIMLRYRRLLEYQDTVLFAPLPKATQAQELSSSEVDEGERGEQPVAEASPPVQEQVQPRLPFSHILEAVEAACMHDNPREWKEAIVRLDEELDALLRARGVGGLTPEERLKRLSQIAPAAARALEEVRWRAEEIRHKSSDYVVTKKEVVRALEAARRVLSSLETPRTRSHS